jgi:hypothetical protein
LITIVAQTAKPDAMSSYFKNTGCSVEIDFYLTVLRQARQLLKSVVHKITSLEGNSFTFQQIFTFCPGGQKKFYCSILINIYYSGDLSNSCKGVFQ